jgi:hypothetical protein
VDDQRVSLSSALLRSAHGDAWQAEGRLRAPFGGGAAEIRGARMMASGLPVPKWNNADIVSADVDVDALQAWYAERDVPWGIRVPLELSFNLGEPLFEKRCAGLLPDALRPAATVRGVSIRRASPADRRVDGRIHPPSLASRPAGVCGRRAGRFWVGRSGARTSVA